MIYNYYYFFAAELIQSIYVYCVNTGCFLTHTVYAKTDKVSLLLVFSPTCHWSFSEADRSKKCTFFPFHYEILETDPSDVRLYMYALGVS